MNPKVSVIIPAYNAEKTLPALISNIFTQEESSWEMILVDDGSIDQTPIICDKAADKDVRIRVIHQKNSGLSSARNNGMQIARGEWIAFIDADDLVVDNYLSSMLSAAEQSEDIDLVLCGYTIIESAKTTLQLYKSKQYIGKAALQDAFSHTRILHRCCAWARLYRRSLIEEYKIQYDPQIATEDRTFNYEYMKHIRGLATTANMGYIYGSFSATTLKHKRHSIDSMVLRQQELDRFAKQLCEVFAIADNGLDIIARNLLLFLKETLATVYYNMGQGTSTEKLQQDIFHRFYSEGFLGSLISRKENILSSSYPFINGNFHSFNRNLRKEEVMFSIKRTVRKLIGKTSVSSSYKSTIFYNN